MELNHRREALQASAPPLSYSPIICLGSRARTCEKPPAPKAGVLPTELHPEFLSIKYCATNITTVMEILRVGGWNRTNI